MRQPARAPIGRVGSVLGVLCAASIAGSPLLCLAPALPLAAGDRVDGLGTAAGACESCHPLALRGGHPVGIAPRDAAVPAGWPIDSSGRLTCSTCHLGCGRGASPADEGGAMALRSGRSSWGFCASCHRGATGEFGAGGGARLFARGASLDRSDDSAPYRRPGQRHARVFSVAHPSLATGEMGFAASSRQCLACHDGTVAHEDIAAANARTAPGSARAPLVGFDRASHPVGVPYPTRPKPGSDGSYVPAVRLDPRVRLVDGRVECTSCHDLYGSEEKLLVMPNRESGLCYACHDL